MTAKEGDGERWGTDSSPSAMGNLLRSFSGP